MPPQGLSQTQAPKGSSPAYCGPKVRADTQKHFNSCPGQRWSQGVGRWAVCRGVLFFKALLLSPVSALPLGRMAPFMVRLTSVHGQGLADGGEEVTEACPFLSSPTLATVPTSPFVGQHRALRPCMWPGSLEKEIWRNIKVQSRV